MQCSTTFTRHTPTPKYVRALLLPLGASTPRILTGIPFIDAVGFSLGANLLLRYLGEVGQATPIVASIAMSAGYCGRTGFHILRKNKMYSRVLAKKWLQVIKDNAEVYKDTSVSIEELESKVKTLEDLDRFFSMKLFGEQYPQIEFVTNTTGTLPSVVLDG
jgi:hypothetical protein